MDSKPPAIQLLAGLSVEPSGTDQPWLHPLELPFFLVGRFLTFLGAVLLAAGRATGWWLYHFREDYQAISQRLIVERPRSRGPKKESSC